MFKTFKDWWLERGARKQAKKQFKEGHVVFTKNYSKRVIQTKSAAPVKWRLAERITAKFHNNGTHLSASLTKVGDKIFMDDADYARAVRKRQHAAVGLSARLTLEGQIIEQLYKNILFAATKLTRLTASPVEEEFDFDKISKEIVEGDK